MPRLPVLQRSRAGMSRSGGDAEPPRLVLERTRVEIVPEGEERRPDEPERDEPQEEAEGDTRFDQHPAETALGLQHLEDERRSRQAARSLTPDCRPHGQSLASCLLPRHDRRRFGTLFLHVPIVADAPGLSECRSWRPFRAS